MKFPTKHKQRVGIYAGTFDPVHAGHVGLALQALKLGHLDCVYFMPERHPRGKQNVTHIAHRLGMLKAALQPYPKLKILELNDREFTVRYTLPRLIRRLPEASLVLLMGSDVAKSLATWPLIERLLPKCELIIGMRGSEKQADLLEAPGNLFLLPRAVTLISSSKPHLTSGLMRHALRHNHPMQGLLVSVRRYARAEWLYVSVSNE